MTSWRIIEGDCVDAMRAMPAASVDAVVCDPPYGIGFMGKAWDGAAIAAAAAHDRATRKSLGPESASRPGRAQPRSSSAFGNEAIIAGPVRGGQDFQAWCEAWASEALRVLKPGGHLLAFGGTRTYHRLTCAIEDAGFEIRDCLAWLYGSGFPKSLNLDGDRQGWGTALKPAHEPVVLARKPLTGTVAGNVLAHGTGALNVGECRIGDDAISAHGGGRNAPVSRTFGGGAGIPALEAGANPHTGRWPANVVLDPEAAALLDEQTGELTTPGANTSRGAQSHVFGRDDLADPVQLYGDSGGASRFFYVAKADSAERSLGLHGQRNPHPTVKPVALMRWLCRLVTPPGGTVLDPFTGSGTTGIAALREGFSFLGIEREDEYVAIARARIIGDAPLINGATELAA